MKKIVVTTLLLTLLASTTLACGGSSDSRIDVGYGAISNLVIEVLNAEPAEDKPYEIVYTDIGCDVIIHFKKVE